MIEADTEAICREILRAAECPDWERRNFGCLLLPNTATFAEVRSAYKRLLFLHPDKNPGNRQAEDAFKIITAAFNTLQGRFEQATAREVAPPPEVGKKWSAFTGSDSPAMATAQSPERPSVHAEPSHRADHHTSRWGRSLVDSHGVPIIPAGVHVRPEIARKPRPSIPVPSRFHQGFGGFDGVMSATLSDRNDPDLPDREGDTQAGTHAVTAQHFYDNGNDIRKDTTHRPSVGSHAPSRGAAGVKESSWRASKCPAELLRDATCRNETLHTAYPVSHASPGAQPRKRQRSFSVAPTASRTPAEEEDIHRASRSETSSWGDDEDISDSESDEDSENAVKERKYMGNASKVHESEKTGDGRNRNPWSAFEYIIERQKENERKALQSRGAVLSKQRRITAAKRETRGKHRGRGGGEALRQGRLKLGAVGSKS